MQTHLRFDARQEMPALFLKNEDGSESLLNFHIEHDEVVIHRLYGVCFYAEVDCEAVVVNKAYGSIEGARRSTLSSKVRRGPAGDADE